MICSVADHFALLYPKICISYAQIASFVVSYVQIYPRFALFVVRYAPIFPKICTVTVDYAPIYPKIYINRSPFCTSFTPRFVGLGSS